MHEVGLRHNFETGHRLPHLAGKCTSLHGHSWWVDVTIKAPELTTGTVVEFGAYKAGLRGWIDHYLDHGLMLGTDDPLVQCLNDRGKVFRFGEPRPTDEHGEGLASDLPWPTVENVALLLARAAARVLAQQVRAPGAQVCRVDVQETHVNRASWTA